jgi:hypothetical protein
MLGKNTSKGRDFHIQDTPVHFLSKKKSDFSFVGFFGTLPILCEKIEKIHGIYRRWNFMGYLFHLLGTS